MIPKTIWQTYKCDETALPEYAAEAARTWKEHNPDHEYRYENDEQAAQTVRSALGSEAHGLYVGMPKGVMRADMWRYVVVFARGGVYADLDTLCLEPIRCWVPPGCDMVIAVENQCHLCQWTFAASQGHPLLQGVIDLLLQRAREKDYSNPYFVHHITGPGVWTGALLQGLGLPADLSGRLIDDLDKYELNPDHNVKCYSGEHCRAFVDEYVKHLFGSQNWNDGSYERWIEPS